MCDYISRDAVVDGLNKLCDRVCQYSKAQRYVMCSSCPLGDAFIVIEDDIPAADVRPVLRGHWIDAYPHIANDPRMICSVCGEEEMPLAKNRFCPNCGAELREGADGDER